MLSVANLATLLDFLPLTKLRITQILPVWFGNRFQKLADGRYVENAEIAVCVRLRTPVF